MSDHDRGLAFDLTTLQTRRRALLLFGGAGLVTLVGCASDSGSGGTPTATGGDTGTGTGTDTGAGCAEIPEETAGPFPADGSNGPNVLTESGIVRGDIRSSFGSASGTAEGIPLTVQLTVQDAGAGCEPLPGAAVYLWHCDRDGNYSLYSEAAADQNYLRGVQVADDSGAVTFVSIFPAAYSGRWPHVHFEVYASLEAATSGAEPVRTSQLAFPEDVCDAAYATDGYETSVGNLARTSLDSDLVFSDGYDAQLAEVSGDVSAGYTATLAVPV